MRTRRALALAAVALALALGAAAGALRWTERGAGAERWIRGAAKQAVGYPAWRRRAALREEPVFDGLSASQVGYGPGAVKQFTSPRSFARFRVVREGSGAVAFEGGPPARAVRTDLLGAVETVWIGDFTALAEPGRYRIVTDDGLSSHAFDVSPAAFDAALRAVQRALYFQRAFTAIEPEHAEGPWVHASDAGKAPPGVVGGWHDAGDLSIYGTSATSALFWLLEAYLDFRPTADDSNIPESGNGVPDLLDEARWALRWVLSMQDAGGGFRNTTCQEAYGPYGTNRPESVPPYRAGEVGTLATARAVGTLAHAAHVFRPLDASFAERCLAAAWRGVAYLDAHRGEATDGPTCPNFRQDGDARVGREVRMLAAAGMLLATGAARFRADFEESWEDLRNDPSAYHVNVYAALLYLRAPAGEPGRKEVIRDRLRSRADEVLRDGRAHPFGWASRYFWGSIGAGFQRTGAFTAKRCLEDPVRYVADCEQTLANVHYAFGRNSLGFCFVSGLPGVTKGRTHAFHHWLAALGATPYLFPGMVAGGPAREPVSTDVSFPHARPVPVWGYWGDPAFPRDAATAVDARYTDNDSWSTNEVDVDWQAVTLYHLYFARWWARLAGGADGSPASARGGRGPAGAAPW